MDDTQEQNNAPENTQNSTDLRPLEDENTQGFEAIARLAPKEQRFVHLYMTGQYPIAKLAQLLELHPNTLYKWLKRRDVKDAIEEMQHNTHEMVSTQLRALTVKAMQRLGELTDSPIDGVALQAVKDILDRTGHKPKSEIKVDKTVTTVEEKLNQLIDETIDVDFEEVEEEDNE